MAECGWWWPFEGAVILTERPTQLHMDSEGKLHNPSGPAVLYPDGFSVYAWHGVRIPETIIKSPHLITLDMIESETNNTVRDAMTALAPDHIAVIAGLRK